LFCDGSDEVLVVEAWIERGHGWLRKAPATRAGEAREGGGQVPVLCRHDGLAVKEKGAANETYPQACRC